MPNTRMQVAIETERDLVDFISLIARAEDTYRLEDFRGECAVNPGSMLGMLYARADFSGGMYLINLIHDGHFPIEFDRFRVVE